MLQFDTVYQENILKHMAETTPGIIAKVKKTFKELNASLDSFGPTGAMIFRVLAVVGVSELLLAAGLSNEDLNNRARDLIKSNDKSPKATETTSALSPTETPTTLPTPSETTTNTATPSETPIQKASATTQATIEATITQAVTSTTEPAYTITPTRTPSSSTMETERSPDTNEGPKNVNFNRNMISAADLPVNAEKIGLGTSLIFLTEGGDTFAAHMKSAPPTLPENLILGLQFKNGSYRFIDLRGSTGHTLVISEQGKNFNLQFISRSGIVDFNKWQRVDADPNKLAEQPGIPAEYADYFKYIQELVRKQKLVFPEPRQEYGIANELNE